MLRNNSLGRYVSILTSSILSSLTWYNLSGVCAARTSGRRLCLSTLHFGGPSTAAWPDHWCPLCARGSCGGARQGLSWISQPAEIQFSNADHREMSLSGTLSPFVAGGAGLQKHPPSSSQAPNFSCITVATANMEKQLSTWTKEKEAIWPITVKAQWEQRLNAPADEPGQDWRWSSLKNGPIKRAAWQPPDLVVLTPLAGREQQSGSTANTRCDGLANAWHDGLAHRSQMAGRHGQHMAGWHSQAVATTVSPARSHDRYL